MQAILFLPLQQLEFAKCGNTVIEHQYVKKAKQSSSGVPSLPHLKVTYEMAENHHTHITFEEWRQSTLEVLHGQDMMLLSGYYPSVGWLGWACLQALVQPGNADLSTSWKVYFPANWKMDQQSATMLISSCCQSSNVLTLKAHLNSFHHSC